MSGNELQPIVLARKKRPCKPPIRSRVDIMMQNMISEREEARPVLTAKEIVRQAIMGFSKECKGRPDFDEETLLPEVVAAESEIHILTGPPSADRSNQSGIQVVMTREHPSEETATNTLGSNKDGHSVEVLESDEAAEEQLTGEDILLQADEFLKGIQGQPECEEIITLNISVDAVTAPTEFITLASCVPEAVIERSYPTKSNSSLETSNLDPDDSEDPDDPYSKPNADCEINPDSGVHSKETPGLEEQNHTSKESTGDSEDPNDPDFKPNSDCESNPDSDVHSKEETPGPEQRNQHSKKSTGKKPKKVFKPTKKQKEEQKRKREVGDAYLGMKRMRSDEKNGENEKSVYDYLVSRPSREIKGPCNCKMSLKSSKLACRVFTESGRKAIHLNFWKHMTWDVKRSYVAALVDCVQPKFLRNRKNDPNNSRRAQTLKFHLKLDGERLLVCKNMFLNTLGVTNWWVLDCVKSNKQAMLACGNLPEHECTDDDEPSSKSRALMARNKRKMDSLRNFFASLPKMESHYCRQNTSKLYLEPLFQSKTDVYNLYKKDVDKPDGPGIVALQTFYIEFDRQKLSIYVPRKDLCDTCVSYAAGNCSMEKYEEHQARKELARKEKQLDNEGPNFVSTMDLQGVLLCPRLNASSIYYKMKLCVHNFTLFNNKTHHVKCYVWHEGEGGITSNEFASLITTFIRGQSLKEGQDVILWSDGAGYQNRNVNLSMALLNLSHELNTTIIQKYLEVGHTQMECDSIHALIEKKARNKTINTPYDYVNIMLAARKNPFPYEVEYLDHTAFKDFSTLGPRKSIRPGSKPGDPCVNDIRALKYSPSGEMFFKLSFTEEWRPFETPRQSRRSSSTSSDGMIKDLYDDSLPIKPDKYTHLQQLKQVIAKDYHSFYDNLRHQL